MSTGFHVNGNDIVEVVIAVAFNLVAHHGAANHTGYCGYFIAAATTDLVAGETTDQTTDNGAYTSTGSGSGSRTVTLITGGAAAAGAAAVPAAGGCEQAAMLISISASTSEDL